MSDSQWTEVFPPEDTRNPERVFYTLTARDVGKGTIQTSVSKVDLLADLSFGRVQKGDVGKRLYGRLGVPGWEGYYWEAENDAQRDARLAPRGSKETQASEKDGGHAAAGRGAEAGEGRA
jgi:hypothetical protein